MQGELDSLGAGMRVAWRDRMSFRSSAPLLLGAAFLSMGCSGTDSASPGAASTAGVGGGVPADASTEPPGLDAGQDGEPSGPPPTKANVVFVLADDLAWNLVEYMPNLQQMQKDGVTFSRYFVTDSLCC